MNRADRPKTGAKPTREPRIERDWVREAARRAFASFLAVPTAVVLGFVLLAVGTYTLDQTRLGWLEPPRERLQNRIFGSPEATSEVLGTIAGSTITITSITFSLLLVTLQQSAGTLTHAVFDQFLRRRLNQVYFGWFVGIALYTLLTLATVDPPFNPVFGATIALALAVSSLYVLLVLVYAAIEQMQPVTIVEAIHDHTLRARDRQDALLHRTRRSPSLLAGTRDLARAQRDGFVVGCDIATIGKALAEVKQPAEVVLRVPVGAYVAFQDPLAETVAPTAAEAARLAAIVEAAVRLARERDLDHDPAYGIEQMETIAWTSISTSKQSPEPGLFVVFNLRDLLARWAADAAEKEDNAASAKPAFAVVYPDDLIERLIATFESLAVVASESMQHQVAAEIFHGLAIALDRLPAPWQRRVAEAVLRMLPGLGDHVLTTELDDALAMVSASLDRAGHSDGARAVRAARDRLATTIGLLNSRATRVPSDR